MRWTRWCWMPWEVITMFETIKRLYAKTENADVVARAVKKGWITQEQGEEIIQTKA